MSAPAHTCPSREKREPEGSDGSAACVIFSHASYFRTGESGAIGGHDVRPAVKSFFSRMGILQGFLNKLGLSHMTAHRARARVFLLDDDVLRHEWFARQFKGDRLDIAADAPRAIELLAANYYDLIFLDHDLLPEHYYAESFDDERSGYAVARWLAERPDRLAASDIVVHTRNADGALRMVELLRRVGRQAEHVPFHQLAPKIKQLRRR